MFSCFNCLFAEPEEKGIEYHTEGMKAVLNKEYKQAVGFFKSAANCKATSHNLGITYYNLGIAYAMLSDFNEAENAFKQALEYLPKDADAHQNLGALYLYNGKFEKAVSQFDSALKLGKPKPPSEELRSNIELLSQCLVKKVK